MEELIKDEAMSTNSKWQLSSMCLKAKLPKISGDMNDFYEFMLYVIGAMKHFGMGPLAIKISFGFCPSSISLGANPNAMIPKEYLDFINIYARKMMGQNSGQFIGFSSIMREKEAMRDLEEEFAKEGEKVDAKVDTKKPVKPTAHKRFEEQSTLSGAQTLLSMSKGSKPASLPSKRTNFTNDYGLEEITSENYHQGLLMALIKRIIAFSQSASAQHAYVLAKSTHAIIPPEYESFNTLAQCDPMAFNFMQCLQTACIGTTIPYEVEALLNRRMAHSTISNQESLMHLLELVELKDIISLEPNKREDIPSIIISMTASNKPEMKEIADKLHELMVLHPDTSYDEFVTHVNNKMTRSLNSKSASNHKAKKLVSSEQSEPEPAYAALKPPSRTRNGSPAFRDTDSVTSVRSGQSTTSKTNYIGSYKHLVCKDCGHRGHNSMKYGPCPANENSDSGSYSE